MEPLLMAGRQVGSRNARFTVPMVKRMRTLHAGGVPATAIVRVITIDYGSCPCVQTVRKYLSEDTTA